MKSTIQNLKAARELLKSNGVGSGDSYNPRSGKFCSIGAVAAAKFDLAGPELLDLDNDDHREPYSPDISDSWPEFVALNKQLPERPYGQRNLYNNIYRFNDLAMSRQGDGEEAVLALFDRAIAALESAETDAA